MPPRPRKPKLPPSHTHAARVARGRIQTLITLSPAAADKLAALADARDTTKSAVVESLIENADEGEESK